ncbi:unnamed protein product [Mytilus coruscus]|uniref:Uncharacterized protein n=1 Tax=Mytilus coruscus TaxID=42192 RepID=A0A6J8D257_MYTCO|nr:unnamed protein product [Mytilus coruscus]
MSENKLWKFLNRPASSHPSTPCSYTPILLSDSKGNYLKEFLGNTVVDNKVKCWCKSGSTVEKSYYWLKANIENKILIHGKLWIYIWLGTCNITTKEGNFISISSEDNQAVLNITHYFQEFSTLIQKYPECKITFLEIPVFPIESFNKSRNHPDPKVFKNQDLKLQDQIYELNSCIRHTNSTINSHSPQFSCDLYRRSNYRRGNNHRNPAARAFYNFYLYLDGIHPERILAQVWLRKILKQMKTDCW